MLKTKKAMFTCTKVEKIVYTSVPVLSPPKRIPAAVTTASTRLVSGPASPTKAAPYSSHLTLFGLNGTGLAAKNGGNPRATRNIGSNTVVIRSMCFKGLRVSRPASSAVVSPSLCATKPCIISCKLMAMRRQANRIT